MASQELDWITVKGFKSIASIEKLPLRAINVLIGPNGSGKSNFIGVFSFLNSIRDGKLEDYVTKAGGAEKVLHFGSKVTKKIDLHLSFRDERNQYQLVLSPTNTDELFPTEEWAYFWNKGQYPKGPIGTGVARKGKEAGISDPPKRAAIESYVASHLQNWRLYHFHDTSNSSPMKKNASLNDNLFLKPDGSNLSAFLFYLSEKHQTAYSLIRSAVQRVAPFFDDFQLHPLKLKPDTIQLEWKHKGSDAYFDASSLSDGTLRFIALATLLLHPRQYRPSIILVDEPELGLHPMAITILASLVRAASETTQVILSTQSPLFLDHFEPDDVLVADRVEGSTHLTRLTKAGRPLSPFRRSASTPAELKSEILNLKPFVQFIIHNSTFNIPDRLRLRKPAQGCAKLRKHFCHPRGGGVFPMYFPTPSFHLRAPCFRPVKVKSNLVKPKNASPRHALLTAFGNISQLRASRNNLRNPRFNQPKTS
jgi:predicted ATPase